MVLSDVSFPGVAIAKVWFDQLKKKILRKRHMYELSQKIYIYTYTHMYTFLWVYMFIKTNVHIVIYI